MSTKARKRKKKKGSGPSGAAPLAVKAAPPDRPGSGTKSRNWAALKKRYMDYEFLTYTQMALATGIQENAIGKHAAVNKDQPETWKDERSRKTRELAEAEHEANKAKAGTFNAKMRAQLLSNAEILETKAQQSLLQAEGNLILHPRDAIRAMAVASQIKDALISPEEKRPAAAAGGFDGDEDEGPGAAHGLVVLPARQSIEQWTAEQRKNLAPPAELPDIVKKPKK